MNKKLFLGMFAAAGMLLATSCSNDELDVVQSGNEAQVTFSLGLEGGIATRAISDGTGADVLMYAVFDKDGKRINTIQKVSKTKVTFPATEKITLAKGQTYKVAFWAQDEDCEAYTVSDDMQVTVSYANDKNKVNNDETRDAFFKTVEFTVSGNQVINVELKRPFAQINVGVYKADWDAAVASGITIKESSVVVKNAATSIDLVTGEVGEETTDVEVSYAKNTIPNEDLKVDLNGDKDFDDENEKYHWLSMSYILVADRNADTDNSGVLGDERATLESLQYTFYPESGNNITFGDGLNSVPVQRNWRTNILGKLLTGDIQFNIVIDADFIDSPENDYIVSVWDGESATTPVADADGVYRISSAEELVGMMNDSKSPNCNNYQNVVLECDIDLGGNTISGFGDLSGFFDGIFDGQGHSISNFKIDATNRTYYAGLFNQVSQYSGTNTVIKNLIVKNATVAGTSQVGVIVGGMNGNTIVENCKVYNSTVKAVKKVGSVVGYTAGGTVKDNYAENCVIEYSEKEASEILGYENTGSTVSGNTFNNITFVVSATALATELTPDANGVITLTRDYTVTGNWTPLVFSENITINGNGHTIQGLDKALVLRANGVNISINDLTIAKSNISYSASDANETALGVGGFISYMDYAGTATFNNCHLKNSTVNGNERAAGLIGYTSGNQLTVTNCTVEGCTIKATGSTGGIVAHTQTTVSISGSKVENSTIESTEDRSTKAAIAGGIIGTIVGATTFDNVTVSGNTVINNGATPLNEKVGRVVSPGSLTDN